VDPRFTWPIQIQTSPFVFPFTVKNSSKLFKLTDVEWTCHVSHMEVGNNNAVDDMTVGTIGKQSTVDAGDISNHVCNVTNPGVPIHNLNMDVTVHYTILGYFHPSANKPFTWMTDGERSKWIEGNECRLNGAPWVHRRDFHIRI
jgi:hypothetical protein